MFQVQNSKLESDTLNTEPRTLNAEQINDNCKITDNRKV